MSNKVPVQHIISHDSDIKISEFAKSKPNIQTITRFLSSEFNISITDDIGIIKGFERDGSNIAGEAEAVCRPSNEHECALILASSHRFGIQATISAGRTNLNGSATPQGGLLISMEKMVQPKPKVSISSKTVVSPVGIFLEDMRLEVLRQSNNKLCYPVDPTSRQEATVGGTISCNASGFTPGPKGATRYWTDYLEFLTPDGCKISCKRGDFVSKDGEFIINHSDNPICLKVPTYPRPRIKNASGPFSEESGEMDLVDFMVGSEGIYGIITLVKFRLKNMPDDFLDLFFTLHSEELAIKFYHYINNLFGNDLSKLTALEYFGHNCQSYMNFSEDFFRNNSDTGIYIQVPLYSQKVENVAEDWLNILRDSDCDINLDEVIILGNVYQRRKFFESRHSIPSNALERSNRLDTLNIMTDTIVPPENFRKFLQLSHAHLQASKIEYVLFGHLGDCHLHFHFMPTREQLPLALKIYDDMIQISSDLGGVYSAEHGTGKRKQKDFIKCFGKEGVEQIRVSKSALDKDFLLNRGNVIKWQ